MRKKIIGFGFMAIMALAASWNIKQSNNAVSLSDLALSNVEALANSETDYYNCWYYGCKFDYRYNCTVYSYGGYYIMTCSGYRA